MSFAYVTGSGVRQVSFAGQQLEQIALNVAGWHTTPCSEY